MPVIRNKLSSVAAGGPRQFAELQDKLLVSVGSFDAVQEARSELGRFGLSTKSLNNVPVIIAEPETTIDDVLDQARRIGLDNRQIRRGIEEATELTGDDDPVIEATDNLIAATTNLLTQVRNLRVVNIAEFSRSYADYGPENLRIRVQKQEDISIAEAKETSTNLRDIHEGLGVTDAWEETRGENAIYCVFDTGYAEGLVSRNRIIASFNGGGTDSVYASGEGHGTMTLGAAAANANEDPPFNGVAPDADVILVRITDNEGQIRSDIISEAWDWLADLNLDRPIVANHSYGTPLCTGRPRTEFCDTALNEVIKVIASDSNITPVYAAGNEAMRCGHRPSGLTNAITGTNSLAEVITLGALLSSGREAQRYSSHGRGDCAPIADPKPNVSCRIPEITYYGDENGWRLKDMSTGPFGSGGGTSHASPTTAGIITLMQSKAVSEGDDNDGLQTEEIKQILQNTAELPRRTQVSAFGFVFSERGYDARFGNGEVRVNKALSQI